jgi:hypothetical protein
MISKFFEKMDALPVVKLLQVTAVAVFIFKLVSTLKYWDQAMGGNNGPSFESILPAIMFASSTLSQALYDPMFLLGLAELIKNIKKPENNKP